jgi:hypothetical protein
LIWYVAGEVIPKSIGDSLSIRVFLNPGLNSLRLDTHAWQSELCASSIDNPPIERNALKDDLGVIKYKYTPFYSLFQIKVDKPQS